MTDAEPPLLPTEPEELYAWIRSRNEREYGTKRLDTVRKLGTELHPSDTDVIAELVQNAEDAGATRMGFEVLSDPDGLVVWNDGRTMSPENVAAISGMLDSSKAGGSIGYFGIGFKSVLALCDSPCVVSGNYRFELLGCLDPIAMSESLLPAVVRDRAASGSTVFWLRLRKGLTAETVARLRRKVQEDDMRLMFFLEGLSSIDWSQPGNAFLSSLLRTPKPQGATLLQTTPDDDTPGAWLLLKHQATLTEDVAAPILEALTAAGSARVERVSRAVGQPTPLRFVFDLPDQTGAGAVRAANHGLLGSGLPTGEPTGLRFHMEGWIPLSISRAQAKLDDPLAVWTISQLANRTNQSLTELVAIGKWDAQSLEVVPMAGEAAPAFGVVAEALRQHVADGRYFADENGQLRGSSEVVLAHRSELYEVLTAADLAQIVDGQPEWAATALRQGRCQAVARDLGVRELTSAQFLSWLSTSLSTEDLLQARGRVWLLRLFDYLRHLPAAALQDLPILPTTAGLHKPGRAMLPPDVIPDVDEETVRRLPVVEDWVIQHPSGAALLKNLSVREFSVARMLESMAQSLEVQPRPSTQGAANLVVAVSVAITRGSISKDDARRLGSIAWLPTKVPGQKAQPEGCVLGRDYGRASAEHYLTMVRSTNRLVSPQVLRHCRERGLRQADVVEAMRLLGCADSIPPEFADAQGDRAELNAAAQHRGMDTREAFATKHPLQVVDVTLPGLATLISGWKESPPDIADSAAVVAALVGSVGKSFDLRRNDWTVSLGFAKSALLYRRYSARALTGVAEDLLSLKAQTWLPDLHGTLRRPSDLVVPAVADVFGPDVPSLDPAVLQGLSADQVDLVSDLLEIQRSASLDSIVGRLRVLQKADEEPAAPLYQLLAKQSEDELSASGSALREIFAREPLVWSRRHGWQPSTHLCWADSSAAIPGLSESWPSLKQFFLRVGVAETPDATIRSHTLSIAHRWATPDDPSVKVLIDQLNKDHVAGELRADGRATLVQSACWPGAKSTGLSWAHARDIVVFDEGRRSKALREVAPIWDRHLPVDLIRSLGARSSRDAAPFVRSHGVQSQEVDERQSIAALQSLVASLPFLLLVLRSGHPQHLSLFSPINSLRPVHGLEIAFELEPYRGDTDSLIRAWPAGAELLYSPSLTKKLGRDFGDVVSVVCGEPALREFVKDLWAADDDVSRWELTDEYTTEHGFVVERPADDRSPFLPQDPHAGDDHDNAQGDIGALRNLDDRSVGHGEDAGVDRREPTASPPSAPDNRRASAGNAPGLPEPVERSQPADPRPGENVPALAPSTLDQPSEFTELPPSRRGGTGGSGFTDEPDVAWNEAIERQAVRWVTEHLEAAGALVTSVENDYVGYDLNVVLNDGATALVEVKGRSSLQPTVSLSRNEYQRALQAATNDEHYLLVIVAILNGVVVAATKIDPRECDFVKIFVPTYQAPAGRWMRYATDL